MKYIIILIIMFVGLIWAFEGAVDKHIENQDEMLCRSALKSGNVEYLEKCEDWYKQNNIEYWRIDGIKK